MSNSDFDAVLQTQFPGAVPESHFVRATYEALRPLGFTADNTIACVGVCRDELCQPLTALVHGQWGEAFNFASLAGILLLGRAGFLAAHAHAPVFEGRRRYAYVVMPHLGLGSGGAIGECSRAGLPSVSHACGALCALQAELQSGRVKFSLDLDDPELSLVRMRLGRLLQWGQQPNLLELTLLAEQAMADDLDHMIELTVDPGQADYAVLTGLLIHGPARDNYVRAGRMYAVVRGQRHELVLPAPPAAT
jgi:hypothetical protein